MATDDTAAAVDQMDADGVPTRPATVSRRGARPEKGKAITVQPDAGELASDAVTRATASWPISLVFSSLRSDSKTVVTVEPDESALWGSGDARSGLVGWSIEATRDAVLDLRSFIVNTTELFFQTNGPCQEIRVRLYVHTAASVVRGRVDLPPGASVTLESAIDRTSVIGLSSFSLALG